LCNALFILILPIFVCSKLSSSKTEELISGWSVASCNLALIDVEDQMFISTLQKYYHQNYRWFFSTFFFVQDRVFRFNNKLVWKKQSGSELAQSLNTRQGDGPGLTSCRGEATHRVANPCMQPTTAATNQPRASPYFPSCKNGEKD
jgi:hypothetical protein